MDLRDRVVVITGAARGIGREFARSLGAAGASIVATDRADCADTADLVAAVGGKAIAVKPCEWSRIDGVDAPLAPWPLRRHRRN